MGDDGRMFSTADSCAADAQKNGRLDVVVPLLVDPFVPNEKIPKRGRL